MQTYKELIQLLQYIAVQDKCVHTLLTKYVHPVVCNKLFNAIHTFFTKSLIKVFCFKMFIIKFDVFNSCKIGTEVRNKSL